MTIKFITMSWSISNHYLFLSKLFLIANIKSCINLINASIALFTRRQLRLAHLRQVGLGLTLVLLRSIGFLGSGLSELGPTDLLCLAFGAIFYLVTLCPWQVFILDHLFANFFMIYFGHFLHLAFESWRVLSHSRVVR